MAKLKWYEVAQEIVQTLYYHVEAESAEEAVALVNAGQVPEAYEDNGEIKGTKVQPMSPPDLRRN